MINRITFGNKAPTLDRATDAVLVGLTQIPNPKHQIPRKKLEVFSFGILILDFGI